MVFIFLIRESDEHFIIESYSDYDLIAKPA